MKPNEINENHHNVGIVAAGTAMGRMHGGPMQTSYPLVKVYITNLKITMLLMGKLTISTGHAFNSEL